MAKFLNKEEYNTMFNNKNHDNEHESCIYCDMLYKKIDMLHKKIKDDIIKELMRNII